VQIDIPYALFVGIDIGSEELMTFSRDALAVPETSSLVKADWHQSAAAVAYPQSKCGYQKLERALRKQARQRGISETEILITMEATGNFWLPPASYLYRAGFDIMVINPSSARHYAGMKLKRSKSDPIDATILASLGLVYAIDDHLRIRLWHEPPPIYDELRQRINLFSQMSKLITQTTNRQRARAPRQDEKRCADYQRGAGCVN
jgi:transposase